ncbi:hypothetical protein SEA_GUEY18_33 [Gordonia phage Guey18]|nr:hypothetical protein SEA_GUEY18_33 [Gordonia phage Guey18]
MSDPMPNDAELFDHVADILERDGWCQHEAHYEGSHCALGALEVAAKETYGTGCYLGHYPRVYKKVTEFIVGNGNVWSDVPEWNDASNRTAQEVVDKYRELAKEETKRADGN